MKDIQFTFHLTYEEANIILAGLQELPAKVCNPLTQKLQQQAHEQMPKSTEPSPNLEVVK